MANLQQNRMASGGRKGAGAGRLDAGDMAPAFEATDIHGEAFNLEAWRGHVVLVSFYRYASCPLCNLRVHELSQRYADWSRQGLRMVGVFQSEAEEMRRYVAKQDAPFPLLADPQMEHYRRWGVERSWWGLVRAGLTDFGTALRAFRQGFLPGRISGPINRQPADFLIGPNGQVLEAFYALNVSEHLPMERIEALMDAFSATTTSNHAQ